MDLGGHITTTVYKVKDNTLITGTESKDTFIIHNLSKEKLALEMKNDMYEIFIDLRKLQ